MLKLRHLLISFLLLLTAIASYGQGQIDSLENNLQAIDSIQLDSITSNLRTKSDVETTIRYHAGDSIRFNIRDEVVHLYGDSEIDYGEINLKAEKIKVDWVSSTLDAIGKTDSMGTEIGYPIFRDGGEEYQTREIKYNFKTKNALISGAVTQQGEAYIHSEKVKKNAKGEIFSMNNKYTTCDKLHPHFYISAKKIKMIPNDKIVTGPFNLVIMDIPTPIGFPFGMFPSPKKNVSGVIIPTFGEERLRGFYLRDGGYYFAINDYINLTVLGEMYSKGSTGLNVSSSYKKRYQYTGGLNFRYNKNVGTAEEDSLEVRDFWLSWRHAPQTKGNSRFSASVNAGTSTYNQNNSLDMQSNLKSMFSSNISYSKTFKGTPFNMAMSARHSQNVRTNLTTAQLPELSFNMNQIHPFKGKNAQGNTWYHKINMRYNFISTNSLTNKLAIKSINGTDSITDINMETLPSLLQNSKNGGKHTIPISTSLKLFKYFTLTPSFSYTDTWYLKEKEHFYNETTGEVDYREISKFSRNYQYATSASLNTRIYGTKYFNNEKFQAIRHVMTPSLSFSYRPDFSDSKYGFYQEIATDTLGNTDLFSIHEGYVYGSPGAGKSGNIRFSLNNNVEAKILTKRDTTGKASKVSILDNLSINANYNLMAESFKLSPISLAARTKLFNKKLNITINTTINPYTYQIDSSYYSGGELIIQQSKLDEYAWNKGEGLGQISNARISMSTSLNPRAREDRTSKKLTAEQLEYINANPDLYVDFNIPWNLRLSYNVSYSKVGYLDPKVVQSTTISGNINLTDKWKIGFNAGYDLVNQEFTTVRLNIDRDLHCWQMNFSWIPFGRFTSYNLSIHAKASVLQDLKLNKRHSFFDN